MGDLRYELIFLKILEDLTFNIDVDKSVFDVFVVRALEQASNKI